ncbi:MAG: glycosyltransferase [Planctomycetota bacterium]|jgi:hypothetical protein
MRIFYLCPDFAAPSGGVKRLYTHVQILIENGYDAYIMHFQKGFRADWFSNQVPIIYSSDLPSLSPKDTIVIPEGLFDAMRQLKSAPLQKVAIALSSAYIFRSMPLGENWKDYGIEWVMTNNKITRDLIQWSMGIKNIYIVASSIDHDMFYYKPDVKTHQLAYIKRKDTLSPMVEKILKLSDASFGKLDFIAIGGLNIQDYAQVLIKSKIYLTTAEREGFPCSIIEAMACGCLCIGFDGIGGKDYIVGSGDKQNFVLAENANFIDLSRKLADLVERLQRKDPAIENIRQNAISTAGRFTPELESESVLKFWKTFLAAKENNSGIL